MRLVIVTGMSGAGKSTALKMLEDMGYFCVDNLPVPLIPKFAELLAVPGTEMNKAALGVDIRSGQSFQELANVLKVLDEGSCQYEILYLESSDDVLVKRYKETRRFHPLAGSDGRVEDGLKRTRTSWIPEEKSGLSCRYQSYAYKRTESRAEQDICPEQGI